MNTHSCKFEYLIHLFDWYLLKDLALPCLTYPTDFYKTNHPQYNLQTKMNESPASYSVSNLASIFSNNFHMKIKWTKVGK